MHNTIEAKHDIRQHSTVEAFDAVLPMNLPDGLVKVGDSTDLFISIQKHSGLDDPYWFRNHHT